MQSTYSVVCFMTLLITRRSQWPCGLKRGSAAARLLRSWVRIPPGAWMSACCDCCVLSGRGFCDWPITRPEEFYRVWCVWVWSWILDNDEALAHWEGFWGKKINNPVSMASNVKTNIEMWFVHRPNWVLRRDFLGITQGNTEIFSQCSTFCSQVWQ